MRLEDLERLDSILCAEDLVPSGGQYAVRGAQHGGVVVDEQDGAVLETQQRGLRRRQLCLCGRLRTFHILIGLEESDTQLRVVDVDDARGAGRFRCTLDLEHQAEHHAQTAAGQRSRVMDAARHAHA